MYCDDGRHPASDPPSRPPSDPLSTASKPTAPFPSPARCGAKRTRVVCMRTRYCASEPSGAE
jgi:hypothetical protein